MKRFHHFVFVFAAVALLLTAHPLNAQNQGQNCSNLVINHSFTQGFEGFLNEGGGPVPTAGAGFVTFLPHGMVKGQVTLAIGGPIGLLRDLVFDNTSSSYSLSWDTTKTPAICSGTMTLIVKNGPVFDFQLLVTQDGQQIEMIHTDPGLIVGVTGFPVDIPGCSNTTLNGKYSYNTKGWALAPPGVPPALAGYIPLAMSGAIEFHPRVSPPSTSGFVVWWDTASANGIIVPRTGTGSYKVNPDCTGTMVLTDPTLGQVFNLELFVGKHGEAPYLLNIDTVPVPGSPLPVILSSALSRVDRESH
jgi:hypothetical protein